jgi:ribosomal protein L16 Arg81 hydroxylase
MAGADFDFARLIAPMDPVEFFDRHWEKEPLVLARKQQDYYGELLSMQAVDEIITSTDLRYPAVRLVKNGSPIPPQKYASNVPWGDAVAQGVVDVAKVLDEFRGGATIVLPSAQRYWRPLSQSCRSIEQYLSHPVHANVYLTPKAEQGFSTHYDPQETFILQVSGSKHWRLYGSPVPLPHPSQPYMPQTQPGAPQQEFDLQAGDLLYMPRGFLHDARALATDSLHITMTASVTSWVEVFAEVLSLCKQDARFRASLPVGFLDQSEPWSGLQGQFEELQRLLMEKADLQAVLAKLAERFVSSRQPMLDGQLMQLQRLNELTSSTLVSRRDGVVHRLVHGKDSVILFVHGKRVEFPQELEPALRFVVGAGQFDAEMIPGEMAVSSKLDLVRRLVEAGFLRIGLAGSD